MSIAISADTDYYSFNNHKNFFCQTLNVESLKKQNMYGCFRVESLS